MKYVNLLAMTDAIRITAVIPVKQLSEVKGRLSDVLSESQRQALFTAMVMDVLDAVTEAPSIQKILIVTADPQVEALVAPWQVEILPEPEQPGLIESVTKAGQVLAKRGTDAMVFLPGDTPLVSVEELEIVASSINVPNPDNKALFSIVPASDLGGSNCVACSPPDAMHFGFGEDSFRRHLSIARDLGIEAVVLKLPGMGLDIDTADDLRELVTRLGQYPKGQYAKGGDGKNSVGIVTSHTRAFLQEAGISDRFRVA